MKYIVKYELKRFFLQCVFLNLSTLYKERQFDCDLRLTNSETSDEITL